MPLRDPQDERLDPAALGFYRQQIGRIAELEFDVRTAKLDGVSEKASADDQPYDRTVYFGGRDPVTVQVRARSRDSEGKAHFPLGKRSGPRSDRRQPYRRDADYFALAVVSGYEVEEWYIIAASALEGRTTLTITGCRRQRVVSFDPERFRGAWRVLLGEVPPELPERPRPAKAYAPRPRKAGISPSQMAFAFAASTVSARS